MRSVSWACLLACMFVFVIACDSGGSDDGWRKARNRRWAGQDCPGNSGGLPGRRSLRHLAKHTVLGQVAKEQGRLGDALVGPIWASTAEGLPQSTTSGQAGPTSKGPWDGNATRGRA